MKLLFDFLPIVVFFIVYKFYGIYAATAAAIGISVVQVAGYWLKHRKVQSLQLISLVLIVVLGGGTLLLHNELLIKWKPTVLYWILALVFTGTQWFNKKPLIQRLMETNINLPTKIWSQLNISWIIFFAIMGIVNILVAYHFDTNTWVNFKLFGMLGLTVIFVILQAFFLAKHVKLEEKHDA